MSKIYLWEIPDNFPNRWIGEYNRECSPDRFHFAEARPWENSGAKPSFKFDGPAAKLARFDVLPNDTRIPLISNRLASLLIDLCREDFQLIPADVTFAGNPSANFFLLNALVMIEGVCHEESKYDLVPGTKAIMGFNELVYYENAMNEHHIAREKEYPPYVIVSDAVKTLFKAHHVEGAAFNEIRTISSVE